MSLTEIVPSYATDPLKAYKFDVRVSAGTSGRRIGIMYVNGLRSTTSGGQIVLTRGARDSYLHDWYLEGETPRTHNGVKYQSCRDIYITVDEGIEFHVREAYPTEVAYGDLDAGGDSKYIFLEAVSFRYKSIEVRYL